MVFEAEGVAVVKLLKLLSDRLLFFLDPHQYMIVASGGDAFGDAFIDLVRDEIVWRLTYVRGEFAAELRFRLDRDYPAYSMDILKRWISGERDDAAALLTDESVIWLETNLREIEAAIQLRKDETLSAWDDLKRKRAKESF